MLKKIQQYLLLNYPLLWNIKIVPAFLGAVVINILFFLAGYFQTKIDFLDRYSYSNSFSGAALVYMGAVLTAILLFIIWLVFYSKNNAFKLFYPKSSGGLYLEWVLSFVIICGFILFPFSYYQGSVSKIRSYVSKQEMIKAVETLNLIRILIPTSKTSYYLEYPTGLRLSSDYQMKSPDEHSEKLDRSVPATEYVDPVEYAESNDVYYPDYPDFAQLSLLNYDSLDQFYLSSNCDFTIRDSDTVKKWLRQQNKKEISRLMDNFIALQNKHSLKTNLTKDQWLQLIYNPSKYPVGDFNLITSYNYEDEEAKNEYGYYYDSIDKTPNGYYVSYDELEHSYNKIMHAYIDKEESLAFFMISIIMALSISLLVFSFRSTTGKSWLIALISIGLILFINGILSFTISNPFSVNIGTLFYIFVLLAIFSLELISVLKKNINRKAKGRSDIYINHLVWFVPAVPALIFMAIYIIGANQVHYNDYTDNSNELYEAYRFMDEHIVEFIWANICLTFVSMWFFIQMILRKWKSLPEQ